jgi:DNA processing protein
VKVSEDQARLLRLCALPKVDWYLIAREAQRPGGLDRLVRGELSERSSERAKATAAAIAAAGEDQSPSVRRVDEELAKLPAGGGIRLTTVLDDDYPSNLRTIYNLPPFLFYRGTLDATDARSVAVVGTRHASDEGIRRGSEIATELAKQGVTVLSGLARGIDTAAHLAALDAGGRTIAVMGTGILRCYPADNADLAEEITQHGAIVSQFWPSAPPTQYNFPRRNVVTSGMGQGTVVVEATSTSGAKMQARLALEHGKRVFLLHDLVTSQTWAQRYVERGAIEVHTVEDIVRLLRSPEAVDSLSEQRRQLVLDLT